MELEEMQLVWSQMNEQLEKQKKLTNKLIMEMTQARFRNKLGIISKYETLGAVICYIAAFFLLINFPKLNTWYLLICGVFALTFLIGIPTYVLYTFRNLKNINLQEHDYQQIIVEYEKRRKAFLFAERLGIYLSFGFLFVSYPVMEMILDGNDVFLSNLDFVLWYLPIMALFIVFFSRWGYNHLKRITASAEETLKEMDDSQL